MHELQQSREIQQRPRHKSFAASLADNLKNGWRRRTLTEDNSPQAVSMRYFQHLLRSHKEMR
eukprot:1141722-Rhodomonas_salina.1